MPARSTQSAAGADRATDIDRLNAYGSVRRLSDSVAAALLAEVTSGAYVTGQRLPPEREMAIRFGVSRTVIREAIKALSSRGVVTVRPGSGVFVAHAQAFAAAESLRLLVLGASELNYEQIYEVRESLEGRMAELAAQRATPEGLERLEATLLDLDAALTGDAWARADGAFHLVIADMAQNQLFRIVVEVVTDVMTEVRLRVAYAPAARERVAADHRLLVEAIDRGAAQEAGRVMHEHLAHSRDIVLDLDRSMRSARSRASGPSHRHEANGQRAGA